MVVLADDDLLWGQHSGGGAHRGAEWGADDGALAMAFYAALPENARFIFDLLIDHPGERLSADWIAGQLSRRHATSARAVGRRSVSSSLSATAWPHQASGRRLPFYWWRNPGGASVYAMKPGVARLFADARRDAGSTDADHRGEDWSLAEVTATVTDYLAMLTAELAGQRYSKAEHRRALLARLNPVRTAAAVEFKHQNISATMVKLGLPYIRGYKPRSNYQTVLTREIQRRLEATTAAAYPANRQPHRRSSRWPASPHPTTGTTSASRGIACARESGRTAPRLRDLATGEQAAWRTRRAAGS